MNEQLARYMQNLTSWFIVADIERVNLDDLVNMRPGQIVRARGDDALKVHVLDDPTLGCVGGFISEEE